MASTPSERLALRLIGTGDFADTWGAELNSDTLALIDEAVSGVEEISLTGNVALSTTQYVSNESRNRVLRFTDGGLASEPTITLPATERWYVIHNATGGTYALTFSNGSSTVSVAANITTAIIWQTGSTLYGIDLATGTDVATVAPQITNNNLQTVAGQIAPTNNLGTVAGISSDVTTVSGISANVTTVAGVSSDVTAVAGISSDVSGVNAIASDVTAVNTDPLKTSIGNVSGNATNINAVNSNSANINSVAGITSDVTTVAGISSDVTGVNAIASDVTSVSGISANVTTVAGVSSNVTTVAGISSDVTGVAGISANVTTVAGVSSNVTTVADNITDVNNFADLYQISATEPTTDGGGNALSDGDLFFDSSGNELKVYNGSAWQGGVTATGNFLLKSSNLSDLASASTARTNLGLATVASTGAYADVSGTPTHLMITGGSAGTIPYQTSANVTAMLAVGVAGQILQSNGTSAPTWVNQSSGGGFATQFKYT
ncbi:MAG: hypothetical protein CME70_17670 [Halobacteriovorax sp.]|nr:hypothetical protein [Halobacteriovorax sp.]|tara:strand:+ start:33464 stop:34936 length:1473 start_codon:yes stop_codon:yes gene_type:complete